MDWYEEAKASARRRLLEEAGLAKRRCENEIARRKRLMDAATDPKIKHFEKRMLQNQVVIRGRAIETIITLGEEN